MRRLHSPAPLLPGGHLLAPEPVSFSHAGLATFGLRRLLRVQSHLCCNLPDCSGKSHFQCRLRSNFQIAPDVIPRLPGLTNSRLAPLIRRSGQTYRTALGSRRLLHSSPGLVANLRPSPEPDLQLARRIASGSHRLLQASASPVTQHSACAECCVAPAKLATSRDVSQISRPSVCAGDLRYPAAARF